MTRFYGLVCIVLITVIFSSAGRAPTGTAHPVGDVPEEIGNIKRAPVRGIRGVRRVRALRSSRAVRAVRTVRTFGLATLKGYWLRLVQACSEIPARRRPEAGQLHKQLMDNGPQNSATMSPSRFSKLFCDSTTALN